MSVLNPNCDGSHCPGPGEVRVLPLARGGESNLILCRRCFQNEIRWRVERNRELSPESRFDLPEWESLKVYEGA